MRRISPRRLTAAAVAAATVLTGAVVAAGPAQAGTGECTSQRGCAARAISYRTGDGTIVAASTPTILRRGERIAAFPSAFVNGSTVWVSYSRSDDHVREMVVSGMLVSRNGGRTFSPYQTKANVENAIVTPAGEQIALSSQTGTDRGGRTATVPMWRGPTWTPATAKLTFKTRPASGSGANFNHGIIRVGDTLLAPYYGRFTGDPNAAKANRVELAASADGVNWHTRATVVRPFRLANGNVVTYSEAALVRLGSGALMLIARSEEFTVAGNRVALRPMVYSISADAGRTWRAARPVLIGGRALAYGARPSVLRLGNGRYVLATGRPDNVLAFANRTYRDGSPVWTGRLLAYQNHPYVPAGRPVLRWSGSSGYAALAPVSPTTLLAVFDNCAATWGCSPPKRGFTISNEPRLVSRWVRVS